MPTSPMARLRVAAWIVTGILPVAAWFITRYAFLNFHPGVGVFFTAAACLSAAIGGMPQALASIALNGAAMAGFVYLYQPETSRNNLELWVVLLVAVALIVGYARQKWWAAEKLAGRLISDLARLRDELESQRTDLKRFHELSVRLSSSLELQRLLNDVLTSVASLQKTDLAMLLVLPQRSSKQLRVEAYTGFTSEQIKLFGEITSAFFSPERRVLLEDIGKHPLDFPFLDAAQRIGFRSVFSIPIVNAKGEPLGVVASFFRNPHSPSDRQSRLVELYARQAANALDNARLYRDSLDTLAAEQRRSAVLRSLAEASVQINSALALDSLLQTITDQARSIIGARYAFTTLLPKGVWNQGITCSSAAQGEQAFGFPEESGEVFMLACSLNTPLRIAPGSRGSEPLRNMIKTPAAAKHGWLAAPLVTRDGRNLGLIQLSQKLTGDFSADDEAILVQLAHMASVAVDNVRLYREAQEQIAETKRAQEALERSKEAMELAQQYVGIGVWEWDLQTGALAWSDQIRRLHGFTAETFDGRYETWMEAIHPEDRTQVHRAITQAMARNGEYEVQYRALYPDRSVHWLEARGRAILIGGTPVRMLGVAIDVTSRKLAEEALRDSEKLAATGRLAASIAHEINNPLAAVTNALYILRTNPTMAPEALEYVRTAETELARVVHITRQTLGFYRQISSPVVTSIPELMEDVLGAFGSKIESRKIVLTKTYSAVASLAGFPAELRQLFSNLVLNAVEALPEGGKLSVRVRRGHDGRQTEGVQITVADNGAGIPKENLSRIFEPFFTTKEQKGTGLGLWVSQGIVQKHGGHTRVRSSNGTEHHGTCFRVFLPLAVAAENEVLPAVPPAHLAGRVAATANDLSAA
ncbi:MAG TPA: ATP-binding protein [Terriglobales bacterium]|nr:ATP-binding protein [Terriglobales bacterium]